MWPLWQDDLVNHLSLYWFVVLFLQPPTHFLESLTLLWPRAYWGHKAQEGVCQRIYENFSNADNIKYSQGSDILQYTWSQWTRTHLFHLVLSLVIRLRSQRGPVRLFSGSVSPSPNRSPEHIAVLWTRATPDKTDDFTFSCPSPFQTHFPTRGVKDREDRWPIFRLPAYPHSHMQRLRGVALIQNAHLQRVSKKNI